MCSKAASGDPKTAFRISAQLIDTGTGAHIWADHYDRALDDIFAVQDELTISVVGVIEPTLRKAEIERARRKRPDSLDAYDLYLRALPFAFAAMPQDADKALALLDRAIELEPDYAAVHALIAWCHEQRYLRGGLHEEAKRAALEHARAAITAGGDDAAALATAAFVIAVVEYDYKTATAAFDRSFGLSSSSALALGFSSIVRAWKGDDATAVEQAERAIRLSPFDSLIYLPYVGARVRTLRRRPLRGSGRCGGPSNSVESEVHNALRLARGRPGQPRPRVKRQGWWQTSCASSSQTSLSPPRSDRRASRTLTRTPSSATRYSGPACPSNSPHSRCRPSATEILSLAREMIAEQWPHSPRSGDIGEL